MKEKFVCFNRACVLCAFLIVSSFSFSGVLTVKNITFQLPGTFYYVNSEFVLNAGGSADLQTYSAAGSFYDYAIENLSITISPMGLQQDNSAGGKASGEFYGGGVLTVTGDLMQANNGDPFGPVLASGTILQADMVLGSSETWTLQETSTFSSFIRNETLYLDPSGAAGLAVGIDTGVDTMIIGDMNLTMQFYTPGITAFGGSSYQSAVAPNVQIAAEIPEPATMMLLGVGSVLFLRKKKS